MKYLSWSPDKEFTPSGRCSNIGNLTYPGSCEDWKFQRTSELLINLKTHVGFPSSSYIRTFDEPKNPFSVQPFGFLSELLQTHGKLQDYVLKRFSTRIRPPPSYILDGHGRLSYPTSNRSFLHLLPFLPYLSNLLPFDASLHEMRQCSRWPTDPRITSVCISLMGLPRRCSRDLLLARLQIGLKASRPRCWFRQLMTTHNYHD
jgi:hypothetical protein